MQAAGWISVDAPVGEQEERQADTAGQGAAAFLKCEISVQLLLNESGLDIFETDWKDKTKTCAGVNRVIEENGIGEVYQAEVNSYKI